MTRAVFVLVILMFTACSSQNQSAGPASPDAREAPATATAPAARTQCEPGDQAIASSSGCMVDDATCYQLADGSWCTGDRAPTCPDGFAMLPEGQRCDLGPDCVQPGEAQLFCRRVQATGTAQ
jgi:hypothetical protein